MTNLLKSFYYGLISFLPSFIVGLTIYLLLITVASLSLDNAILSISYYNQAHLLNKILSPFEDNLFVAISLLAILYLLAQILYYITFLKIINPTFKLKNFKNRKQYFFILMKFVLGIIIVNILKSIFDFTLSLSNLKLLVFILSTVFSGLLWTIFILYWHNNGYIADLNTYSSKSKIKLRDALISLNKLAISKTSVYLKILIITFVYGYVSRLSIGLTTSQIGQITVYLPENSIHSYLRFFYNFVFGFSLGTFVFLPLVYSFFTNLKIISKNIFFKLTPVIIIIFIILLSVGVNKTFLQSIDYNKYLINETSINATNKKNYNTAIIFDNTPTTTPYQANSSWLMRTKPTTDDEQANSIIAIYNMYDQRSLFEEDTYDMSSIHCNNENINKIKKLSPYLEGKRYQSVLANDYFAVLRDCYKLNWDTDEYAENSKLAFEQTNSIIDGLIFISTRTAWANYNIQTIKDFKNFLNLNKYHIEESSQKKIAYKFLHYGENGDAKKWFKDSNEDTSKIEFKNKFKAGKITGKININNDLLKNIKVGLLINDSNDRSSYYGINISDIANKRLVATTEINDSGNFNFDNLLEDKYYLGILIKEKLIKEENIKIDRNINKIIIDSKNSDQDLGDININIKL